MITVTTYITPTQCVVLRVVPESWESSPEPVQNWGAATKAKAVIQTYTDEVELEEGTPAVLKLGQFRSGAELAIEVTLTDADDTVLETETVNVTMAPSGSPSVVVRQAVYDALEDEGIEGAFLLSDGLRRPASAAEDIPFVAGSLVIEVGSPSSQKAKRTQVRSVVECEVPIRIYTFGCSTSDAFVTSDTTAWAIQKVIDDTANLRLVGLANIAANDFSWTWSVQAPEVVDVDGSPVPVVVQEITLSVPVIWVSAPAA